MNALGAQAQLTQLGDLILHQRNQRRHHQRRPGAGDPGQLKAQRLAGPGWHHQQHIPPLGDGAAHRFLVGPERGQTKHGLQQFQQAIHRHGFTAWRNACRDGKNGSGGGWRCIRRRECLGHGGANVTGDVGHEPRQVRLAALDAFQPRLPLAGHGRAFDRRLHELNQAQAALGRNQALAVAGQILALEQGFDDLGAGGWRTQAALLHRRRQFLVLQMPASRFHRRQQRRLGQARRRAGLFGDGAGVEHLLRLADRQTRRQALLRLIFDRRFGGGFGLALAGGFVHGFVRADLQDFPADLFHCRPAAVVAIHDGRAIRFQRSDRGDERGDRPDMVIVPGHQQAAANQVVQLLLVAGQSAGRRRRRNDGVMVADLGVIHEARTQRSLAGAGRQSVRIGRLHRRDHCA